MRSKIDNSGFLHLQNNIMKEVIENLSLLTDDFSWNILIRNNEDFELEYSVLIDGEEFCKANDTETLVMKLKDESYLLNHI